MSAEEDRLWNIVRPNSLDFTSGTALIEETEKVVEECTCLTRVPKLLSNANGIAHYEPEIVSIGPYHIGKKHLDMIKEHKWYYLRCLISRTDGLNIEHLFQAITSLELQARECYSETINLQTHDFVEMLILDGCFLIELFRKDEGLVLSEENDPLFSMLWILPIFCRDFLKLENQIPFFVLERLFELSKLPEENLTKSALDFFNKSLPLPQNLVLDGLVGMHLLDLLLPNGKA
ncbi:unnamed protein product [Lupinus luteus]|uniref:Uncharacterized protein n=1 Tax=Lupinus luteus TaxID=3873 RepID=A0AAV1WM40_LUPLU